VDLEFGILGPMTVRGRSDLVPRGRTLSLLALLLVHRGATVPVDRIVDELWETAGPEHAKKAVQVVVSRLRHVVAGIVSEGGGYALRIEPGSLDADRFEDLSARGREELARAEAAEAAATLRQALALWRGPALADVGHVRFAQPEIARLEGLRLAALGDRVDADLACGRHVELAGELEALVGEHPLDERLRRQQMLALYRAGRQAEALSAYRRAYAALTDGLGIEPSPELRALEAAILTQDVPQPSGRPAPLAVDVRRLVTCVFAPLAHADLDPESLRAVLERHHDAARTICAEHGGVVAELRNDAVLAVFGSPLAHEDDSQRALRAALELVARTASCCGVCTGEVVAAGAAPVIGEAVGAAERLARSAAHGEIRLDRSTWRLVRHGARATEVDDGDFVLLDVDADAPAIRRRLDRPLIGRDEEVAHLRATFEGVVATRAPRVVTILGPAGIGKSRLVAELAAIAGDGGRVLAGRCPTYGATTAYSPLREIVSGASGRVDVAPAVAHQVAVAVGLEQGNASEDAGWAFVRLIEALARAAPLVIVIDDADQAEPALLDLLRDLERLRDAPALIVCVARHERSERPPGWARNVVELGPLSEPATATLLAAIGGGRLHPAQQRRIAEAASGNPLFLEQLVAYVDERRGADALPPALHLLLTARLDRLDIAERSVLAVGAVAGDTFANEAVRALAAGTRAELEQALERLIRRDLLVPHGTSLRFRHGLVREAAYASLAKTARARLHERYASWLDAADSPDVEARIAFHLEAACRYELEVGAGPPAELVTRAGRALAAAAGVARGRGDLAGEIGFLERALALLGTDGADAAALLPALASALVEAGSMIRAEELAELAVTTSAALSLPRMGARAAIERERIRLFAHPESFDVPTAVAIVTRAAPMLRGDERSLARAAYLMTDLMWLMGDLEGAHEHAVRMLAHAGRAGSGFDVATALTFMGWILIDGPVPVADGIERCDALAAEAAGLRVAELTLLGCRAVLHAMTGREDDARTGMAAARAGLGELQPSSMAVYLALLDAVAETLAGDPAAAERALLDAEAIGAETGESSLLSSFVNVELAAAILAQGRLGDAAEAVARVDTLRAPCDVEWVIKRQLARALLAARSGAPERGLGEAEAAVAQVEGTSLIVCAADAHRTLAEVLAGTGRTDDAEAAVRRALALDEAKGNLAAAAATRERFAALLGGSTGPAAA
jgi:DNA-binding SARP family transcriptional activator